MSLYKTSRCRFFNGQGMPVKPYCNKGDACRYLHPNDAKWSSAERSKKPYGYSIGTSFSAPKASRMRTKTSGSSTPLSTRRSSPLVPQSHLFRQNADDDYPDVKTHRLSYDYDAGDSGERMRRSKRFERPSERSDARALAEKKADHRFDSSSSNWSKPAISRWNSASSGKDFSSNVGKRGSRDADKGPKIESSDRDRTFTGGPRTHESTYTGAADNAKEAVNGIAGSSDKHIRAEKIVGLFRSLANISNEAVKGTAAYNNEEKKLKTYTELSSTLAQISTSAAKAVAPTLADIIGNRAKFKERVENDFQSLGNIWEDIFDVFIQGVVGAVDGGLQDALAMLRKEGELAVKMVVASRSSSLKRKAAVSGPSSSSNDSMKEQASTSTQGSDECDSSRGHKRRRLASSLFEGHHDDAMHLRLEDADTNAMAILKDMKLKMDRQAQTLEALTQENNQLKASLCKQPDCAEATESSHSASPFFSCASNSEHEQSDDTQTSQSVGVSVTGPVLPSQLFVESPVSDTI